MKKSSIQLAGTNEETKEQSELEASGSLLDRVPIDIESDFDISVKINSYETSSKLLKFQEKFRSKAVDLLTNIICSIWNDEAIFIFIPFLIWFVQGQPGVLVLFVVDITEILNGYLKWMVQKPRPFWVIQRLKNIDKTWRSDYSFPSSHAQFSSSWSCAILLALHDVIPWYIALLLCLMPIFTGLSRVYLGVHGIECIVSGWIIGILCSISLCTTFQSLFQWVSRLTLVEDIIFLLCIGCIAPYLIFYLILKVFPTPNPEMIEIWTEIAISNTYTNDQDINTLPPKKRQIEPRKYETYHLPIGSLLGGAVGAVIQIANPSLIPNFLTETCEVSKHNIDTLLYTALIGYVGMIILFPFAFIFPSKLKNKKKYIMAHCCKISTSLVVGFWTVFVGPYIAYFWVGSC